MSMKIMQSNSYLSSKNTIKYTEDQNTIKHGRNQNTPKISISGTNTNKNQHADKAKKPNSLEEMFQQLKTTAEDYGKYLTDVLEYHSAAARKFAEMIKSSSDEIEKIREDQTEQNHQVQNADGAEAENMAGSGASVSTNTISDTKISSEIPDSTVVESEYAPIASYHVNTASVNSHIDVKL